MKKMFLIVVLLISVTAWQTVNAQSVTVTPTTSDICAGSGMNVTLLATPSGGLLPTYSWFPGGYTTQSINVSPASTTTYTVTVTFMSSLTATATATVTVNPTPTTPTITPGVTTTICQGDTLVLSSSAATSYQWQQNGSLILGSNVQTYDASTSGDYKVRITDSNGCNSAWSLATAVSVIPLPIAHVTVDNNNVCYPEMVTLTADPVTGASYQWWYSVDGMIGTWSIEPGTTNVIYGTTTGRYGVAVTVGGCTNRSFVP